MPTARYALAPLLLSLLPLTLGCELENPVLVVASTSLDPSAEPLAVSADGTTIWAAEGPYNTPYYEEGVPIHVFDRDTGELLTTLGPWPDRFTVRDVATEYEQGAHDQVWLLHRSGIRTRWTPDGGLTKIEYGIPYGPFPAHSRAYCGMARDIENDVTYVTTHELLTPAGPALDYVWRYDDGHWERSPALLGMCPDITFDAAKNRVVSLEATGGKRYVRWRNTETLDVEQEIELDAIYDDVVAFNGMAALARPGLIEIFDDHGVLIESTSDVDPEGLHVHYGDNQLRLFWTGNNAASSSGTTHAIGSYELE